MNVLQYVKQEQSHFKDDGHDGAKRVLERSGNAEVVAHLEVIKLTNRVRTTLKLV